MPVRILDGDFAFVRLMISADEVDRLCRAHAASWQGGPALEALGSALIRDNVPPREALAFLREVCIWGGGARLVPRVTANDPELVSETLRRALVKVDRGDVAGAVTAIQQLPGLGQSFASKVLRFLRPERAVILDSVIRSNLGYSANEAGYSAFLADCQTVLDRLPEALPNGNPLRLCDVEAAIYAKLQEY